MQLVFVASPLSAQHYAERGKIGWLGKSSFVEQVEEYTCLNTDSSEILVSNIKYIIHNFLHLSEYSLMT
jgi:hypothetical protein